MGPEPDDKPSGEFKKDGVITLLGLAMALEGFGLVLWSFMGASIIILIVVFVAAGGHF